MDSPFSSVIPAPAKAASVLTMEIMGYATLSAGRQHAGKYALRQVLKTHEKIPPSLRPQLRDTPTGVQMVFLSSPAHTCLFALSVLQALGADEPLQPAPLKLSDIRMGLHFGMVHEATDMEMRTCYLGESIKTSVQMVQGAAPGQALASTAFFDALEHMAGDTGGLFQKAVGLLPTGGDRYRRIHEVVPMDNAASKNSRFILTGTLTSLDGGTGKAAHYRINLSLSDTRTGLVIAQSSARASGEQVDTTPTHFYRDSPSLTKDRTVEGQIRTAQAGVGTEADGVYLSSLPVAALVAEGARLYEARKYEEALAVYETAAARPEGRHLRVLNGLYLTNTKLGRSKAAEQAFRNLAMLGLASNSLSVKFLFRPGTTEFWADPQISGVYPMRLRALAGTIAESRSCVTLVGHTSRTGSEQANDRLSLQRADNLQKRLESEAPEMAGRLQSKGMGFHENIIGIGTDDARDSLDRRVDFRVRKC